MKNPGRSRWLFRLGIVLVLALLALFWAVSQQRPTLTIENRSEQTIAELNITIGGQTQRFENVKAGAQVSASGPRKGDNKFSVQGRFTDNKNLIRASGRIDDELHFILLPDGTLQPRRKNSR